MLNMVKFSLEARLFMQNLGFVYEKKTHFIIVIDHLRLVCLKRQVKGNVTFFEGCFQGDFRDVLFVSIQSIPVQKT